jgi:hypothetical protein
MFPKNDAIFQDEWSPIHTARSVQSRFEGHEDALQHLPWPAQSPDLNISEQLWSVLESRVRSKFPPPLSLKQLADCLHGNRHNIPLKTLQNLYDSTLQEGYKLHYNQMVAQLRTNKDVYLSQLFPLFCPSPVHASFTSQVALNILTAVGGHICFCARYSEAGKICIRNSFGYFPAVKLNSGTLIDGLSILSII